MHDPVDGVLIIKTYVEEKVGNCRSILRKVSLVEILKYYKKQASENSLKLK